MNWWKRKSGGINTETKDKKEAPEGVWHKCTSCKKTFSTKQHKELCFTCPECNHHSRITPTDYFEILFDDQAFYLHFSDIQPKDLLAFIDLKPYSKRLEDMSKDPNLNEAIQCASGKMNGRNVMVACMDFGYIGGSMGIVVGERISKSIDYCISTQSPFIIISKSGGARMMESAFSLMQMAKTSAKLTLLAGKRIPYISVLTDPTTGGVSASFAMLGDLNIAEPNALIGFAGPRVIEETIKQKLPLDFQKSESLLENGFLDFIVDRKELKQRLSLAIDILYPNYLKI